jgi:hypothetical protein
MCPAYYMTPGPRPHFLISPPAYGRSTHLADQHLLEYRVVGLLVRPLRLFQTGNLQTPRFQVFTSRHYGLLPIVPILQ